MGLRRTGASGEPRPRVHQDMFTRSRLQSNLPKLNLPKSPDREREQLEGYVGCPSAPGDPMGAGKRRTAESYQASVRESPPICRERAVSDEAGPRR